MARTRSSRAWSSGLRGRGDALLRADSEVVLARLGEAGYRQVGSVDEATLVLRGPELFVQDVRQRTVVHALLGAGAR